VLDQLSLAPQRLDAIVGRVIQQPLDLGRREAELAPDDDLLKPDGVRARVNPPAKSAG
jgi:hypothetical protein